MSAKAQEKSEQKAPASRRDVVAIWIGLLLIVAAVVWAFVRNAHKPQVKEETNPTVQLDSLHVFPAVDFNDSLYHARVLASYEDETPRDVYYYAIDSLGNPTQERVHETHYYEDSKKFMDGNLRNDARDGLWYAYHPNGNVQTMAHYENGKEEGQYTVYHPNGAVYYTGKYHRGKRVGTWSFFDENEQLVSEKNYDENR